MTSLKHHVIIINSAVVKRANILIHSYAHIASDEHSTSLGDITDGLSNLIIFFPPSSPTFSLDMRPSSCLMQGDCIYSRSSL